MSQKSESSNSSQRKLSCLVVISIIVAAFTTLVFWVDAAWSPYPRMLLKRIHENAVLSASHVCPMYECDIQLGLGTKQLSHDGSGTVLQRWCVEVLYTRMATREKGKAAVEVILTSRDDDNINNWQVVNTNYGSGCSSMK
jgi:hypothetical protein